MKPRNRSGYSPVNRTSRSTTITEKGRKAIEYERRKRLHPELDPEHDWVEIPMWILERRGS